MVGAMGHSSMVALGYSLKSRKKIICLDGDGSFLMHLGSSVITANYSNTNHNFFGILLFVLYVITLFLNFIFFSFMY